MEDIVNIEDFLVDGGHEGSSWTGVLLVAAMFIITLAIIYYYRPDFLTGFWRATEEFCAEAEVDYMLLYISEPSGILGRSRAGYVILDENHQGFDLTVGQNWKVNPYRCKCSATVEYDDDPLWGSTITLESDGNTLKVFTDGKLALYAHREF
jgi:hypothetical protein